MGNPIPAEPSPRKPLRLWPGVAIVTLVALARFVVPVFVPEAMIAGVLGGLAGGLAVVLWWLLFSRAPWVERVGAVVLMAAALFATSRLVDKSIATGGMGMLFPVLAVPVLSLAFVGWAVATRRLPDHVRRATMAATILLSCGAWTLVRTGGFTANFHHDLAWRWSSTPEERLLAQERDEPAAPKARATEIPAAAAAGAPEARPSGPPATPRERSVARAGQEPAPLPAAPARVEAAATWPGFRGPHRDGIAAAACGSRPTGPRRRRSSSGAGRSGPGWSSFAVQRRSALHAGAARRGRGRRLLQR